MLVAEGIQLGILRNFTMFSRAVPTFRYPTRLSFSSDNPGGVCWPMNTQIQLGQRGSTEGLRDRHPTRIRVVGKLRNVSQTVE